MGESMSIASGNWVYIIPPNFEENPSGTTQAFVIDTNENQVFIGYDDTKATRIWVNRELFFFDDFGKLCLHQSDIEK